MSGPEAAAGPGPAGKGAELEPLGPLDLLDHCGRCRKRLSPQREPRLLPCLHSVCGPCLGGDGAVFECPVCHHQCPLGDVLENFFLQDSGAGATTGPEPLQSCTSCEDNAAATRFCNDCSEPLCETCVQAHLRVRYTRGHSVRDIGPAPPCPVPALGPCPEHPEEPRDQFCSTCATLTCRLCQLSAHQGHRSRSVPEAVPTEQALLQDLSRCLGTKLSLLQHCQRHLRGLQRRGSEAQQRLQVEVKMAILQVMRELNKRGKVLLGEAQKVTEAWQEELERRLRALAELQKHHELVMAFVSQATSASRGAALLLSYNLIHSQIQRSLRVPVEPEEPPWELKFQWDLPAWTRSAENFGTIISEWPLPRSGSPTPAMRPRDSPPSPQVVSNGQVTPRLLLQPPQNGTGKGVQETPWGSSQIGGGALGPPLLPQFPPGIEGLECPELSPPHLEPPPETPELATGPPENTVTGGDRRKPGNSPREEKFKKLLMKRRGPQGHPSLPPKVPRVSLERLELGLALDPALPPPAFRVLPGPSAGQFSVIVIEQGGTARGERPQGSVPVKEEPQELAIGDSGDTKPVGLPPPLPAGGVPGGVPTGGVPVGGVPTGGVPTGGVPSGAWSCRVCGRAGAVVMCDRCQRCFHLHCHLPALLDVPSPDWTCLLCQELPPPSEAPPGQGSPPQLSPLDQQRCELVLLELLCHEPCRALQRPRGPAEGGPALDLTLMRAKLQEKLSPPYRSPEEFARDAWGVLGQLQGTTEDKAGLQSLLSVQRFLESHLSRVFGDRKFWDHPGTPQLPEPPARGGWDHPSSPLASWDPNSAAPVS